MDNSDEILKKIGDKIRVLRVEKGYSQEALADCISISASGLAKIERGETDISIKKLGKISSFFNLNIFEMLNLVNIGYYLFQVKTKRNSINGANINNNNIKNNAFAKKFAKLLKKVEVIAEKVDLLEKKSL